MKTETKWSHNQLFKPWFWITATKKANSKNYWISQIKVSLCYKKNIWM